MPDLTPRNVFAWALAFGVIVLVRWLVGQPSRSRPTCRRCGHDLRRSIEQGAEPARACPGCGRSLDRWRSIRLAGRRSRSRATLAAGLVVVGLAFGFSVWAGDGNRWEWAMPTSVLVGRVEAGGDDGYEAGSALSNRLDSGAITPLAARAIFERLRVTPGGNERLLMQMAFAAEPPPDPSAVAKVFEPLLHVRASVVRAESGSLTVKLRPSSSYEYTGVQPLVHARIEHGDSGRIVGTSTSTLSDRFGMGGTLESAEVQLPRDFDSVVQGELRVRWEFALVEGGAARLIRDEVERTGVFDPASWGVRAFWSETPQTFDVDTSELRRGADR